MDPEALRTIALELDDIERRLDAVISNDACASTWPHTLKNASAIVGSVAEAMRRNADAIAQARGEG